MFPKSVYLGCPYDVEGLRDLNDRLNNKVVEQVNDTQELVMMNSFAHESNEYQIKKCLEERIADISSWRWVLEDLAKRLSEAIDTLRYEQNAIKVVITRIEDEIKKITNEGTNPGALSPFTDSVEETILQEHKFLRDEKKKFEHLLVDLDKQIVATTKTKKRIEADVLNKQQTLEIEEACIKITSSVNGRQNPRKRKKKGPPIVCWENQCLSLKRTGLRALSNCIIVRQKMRGARNYLSIAAEAYAARVGSVLRRRLHSNKIKLQDLQWQKEEAMRDHESLEGELAVTEENLLKNIEQERLIEARLKDRDNRPDSESTRDDVDKKLRGELARLRSFSEQMRIIHERIKGLQNNLTDFIYRTDCCAEDIAHVISLDEERIKARQEDYTLPSGSPTAPDSEDGKRHSTSSNKSLEAIREEEGDNDDDYPLPY